MHHVGAALLLEGSDAASARVQIYSDLLLYVVHTILRMRYQHAAGV